MMQRDNNKNYKILVLNKKRRKIILYKTEQMERHTILLGSLDINKIDSFKSKPREFPGGPVAKTELSVQGPGFDPWSGSWISPCLN